MKKQILKLTIVSMALFFATSCSKDDDAQSSPPIIGSSTTELLVKKFSVEPVFDGEIDEVWKEARPLKNTASVPALGDRNAILNASSTSLDDEQKGLFDPFSGEKYDYSIRGGYYGDYIYLLVEYDDSNDSKDRESWFFDESNKKWTQENKYANNKDDKFYEDKFAFMFPIKGDDDKYPEKIMKNTCAASCHFGLTGTDAGSKNVRHYLMDGVKADFWHWKRVRNHLSKSLDDGYVGMPKTEGTEGTANANGRRFDEGVAMYMNNKITLNNGVEDVNTPKYVILDAEKYYWIEESKIDTDDNIYKVTAVDENGVLTLINGNDTEKTLNPTGDNEYKQGTGNKRIPSIIVREGSGFRLDVNVMAKHTGTGWQMEIKRKLNTEDENDAVFTIGETISFGFAIFQNSAIAHGYTDGLTMKIE